VNPSRSGSGVLKKSVMNGMIGYDIYDWSQATLINHFQMHCFACISPITPWIPFGLLASYASDYSLSTLTVWLTARYETVELSLDYCLFGTTWFNTHSHASYALNHYLNCFQLEGTCLAMILYHNFCTIYSSRSPTDCGWIAVFQFTKLTLHLFCADLRTF
jgi:hypothetical protein